MGEAVGSPNPTVVWRSPDGDILGSGNYLILRNLSRSGGGDYSCHADNGLGDGDTVVSSVTLLYPPSVTVIERWRPQERRMEVILECSAPALPPAQLVWMRRPGTRVTTTDRVVVEEREGKALVLRIYRMSSIYLGLYLCKAENEIGGDEGALELSGRPQAPLFTTDQAVSSEGEYNLTWSVLSLAPVVQYHLQYRRLKESLLGLDSGWRLAVLAEDRLPRQFTSKASYSLRNLQGGLVYQVRVSAVSRYGEGEFSQLLNFYVKPSGPASSTHVTGPQTPILPLFSSLSVQCQLSVCVVCLSVCLLTVRL